MWFVKGMETPDHNSATSPIQIAPPKKSEEDTSFSHERSRMVRYRSMYQRNAKEDMCTVTDLLKRCLCVPAKRW